MVVLSLDIETTAIKPVDGEIIEIGAVLCEWDEEGKEIFKDSFLGRLKSDTYKGEPYALSMHTQLFKELANAKVTHETPSDWTKIYKEDLSSILKLLRTFLKERLGDKKFTLAGKNLSQFDIPWIEYHFKTGANQFISWIESDRRVIDVATSFTKFSDKTLPNLNTCLERAGIDKEVSHNALDDANDVLNLTKYILQKNADN